MIALCARWLYWRFRVYRAEHRPSGPLGSALARFWCTLWLHPGDWFGWLKPLGKTRLAASPTPIGGLSGLTEAWKQCQQAQLGSLSHTPWPGLQQALATVTQDARGYSSSPSLLALLNASNPYGR